MAKTILHMHATFSLPSLSKMQPGNSGFLNKTLPKMEGFFAVKVHGRFSLLEALLEASLSISKPLFSEELGKRLRESGFMLKTNFSKILSALQ